MSSQHLAFERRGEGPPLLLVHGFTGGGAAWPPLLRSALERSFEVIAVDLPGHGASQPRSDPRAWCLPRIVEDLCGVLDTCAARRALWVGYSMGGRIALGAGVLRPERVSALVLEGASPGLADEGERAERSSSDAALADALLRDGLEAFVERWMAQPLFASQRALGPERLAAERRRRLACDPESLAACLRGIGSGAQPSFWGALGELHLPVLLLAGELDAKFRGIAAEMAARIPGARKGVIAGCGHAAHLEDPEGWLAVFRRFAGSLELEECP